MKVTQEKLPASKIGLKIEITPELTQQTYEKVIKNLASTVNIPGFRKGKVPKQVLLQRLGIARIKATALEELVQHSVQQALQQEAIKAIGQPQLVSKFEDLINNYEPGQPLFIDAAVDVEPEVNLKQYTDLQIKTTEIQYQPTQVEDLLQKEREGLATLVPVEGRAAQINDVAVIDYQGMFAKTEGEEVSTEPKPIPGAQAANFQLELQEDKFIVGFITGIVGMNPGETKEIAVQFPDEYPDEQLVGKAAVFTVVLKELKEKELPELNDEFAQEISDFDTLEELRASLETRYQKQAQEQTKSNQQEALLVELLKHTEIDLPETLIEQEIDGIVAQTALRVSQQGVDLKKFFTPDLVAKWREQARPEAIERLKRSLTLREISQREAINVTATEISAKVTEILQQHPNQDIDSEKLHSVVENDLLSEKIINWLLEHSTVEILPESTSDTPQETPQELNPE
jgi:trigger factor